LYLAYALNTSESWPLWARWAVVALLIASVLVESGFTPAGLTYLADVAGQSDGRGAAMGIYTLLLGLGSALGAGLGGWLAQSLALNGIILGTVGLARLAVVGLALLYEQTKL